VDIFPANDTIVKNMNVSPKIELRIEKESAVNCLSAEDTIRPTITIDNIGNMDLSNIVLICRIDTGVNFDTYTVLRDTCTEPILVGGSYTYTFTPSYTVPWDATYYLRFTAYLSCDSALVSTVNQLEECADTKDYYMVNIDNPLASSVERAGSSVQVKATLRNRSDYYDLSGLNITVLVENSQGEQTEKFTEIIGYVGRLETINHTFSQTYVVPNDSVYRLTVFIDNHDNYAKNDTLSIRCYAEGVGVESLGETGNFTLSQNVPNPVEGVTRIDYSVPEAGEVIFHVHSVSGQLLHSRTIEVTRGAQSIELNTATLSAGVYYYSIEYKGQRLVRRMSVQ
jgi:uncharacterized repeat protein (TIGR01451 family)